MGSCLTLRNESSEETDVLTKQEIFLGGSAQVESSRVREPRRTALPYGLGFMVMGLVSGLSLANHLDSRSFLECMHHSAKMEASKDSGRWKDMWHLLFFPNSSTSVSLVQFSHSVVSDSL